jgi:hypothetical protein
MSGRQIRVMDQSGGLLHIARGAAITRSLSQAAINLARSCQ